MGDKHKYIAILPRFEDGWCIAVVDNPAELYLIHEDSCIKSSGKVPGIAAHTIILDEDGVKKLIEKLA